MAATSTPKIVVFDLGGVLARICYTWQDAAAVKGIAITLPDEPKIPLAGFSEFDQFQNGDIDEATYLSALAAFTGCKVEEALDLHNSIIVEQFPGIAEVIESIEMAGYPTGLLSNTNEPHWLDAAYGTRLPAVVRIQHKMASHRVGMSKPDVAIYEHYSATFGFEPESIVYFDDLAPNIVGAIDAGFDAYQIDPHADPAAQIRSRLTALSVLK